ncbi:MAG: 2,3-dihydroxybiphenyl 1,2-dioxygenase [Actinobacteria bacterium]|nr:MAG: 2,3-dihydroxybiphenyl 1,2-dioxygenase [Actinomycetota bacterium]
MAVARVAVKALAYVILDSPDLDTWERFGSDVLGMEPVRRGGDLLLRMDERAHRIVVQPAAKNALVAVGWDVDEAQLEPARVALEHAGREVTSATPDELAARAVAAMIWTRDPDGNRVELVSGAQRGSSPFAGGGRAVSGFVTGELGMGHVVLMTKDQTAMRAFYEDRFGFRLTDYLPDDRMLFLRCNRRHHSLGLVKAGIATLDHLMVEVATIDDVGSAFDALAVMGGEVAADLGRHSNDGVFSFYAWSPGGFMVECGAEGEHIAPETSPVPVTADVWGHHGLRDAHAILIERLRSTVGGAAEVGTAVN